MVPTTINAPHQREALDCCYKRGRLRQGGPIAPSPPLREQRANIQVSLLQLNFMRENHGGCLLGVHADRDD